MTWFQPTFLLASLTSLPYSLYPSLLGSSLNNHSIFQPQGLCTCCSRCLEYLSRADSFSSGSQLKSCSLERPSLVLLFNFFFYFMCVCVCVCVCAHALAMPMECRSSQARDHSSCHRNVLNQSSDNARSFTHWATSEFQETFPV